MKRIGRPGVAWSHFILVRSWPLIEIPDDEFAQRPRVPLADADGTEQVPVVRVARDEGADAAPEEIQRLRIPLIFRAHERAAKLDTRRHSIEKRPAEVKQRARVQAAGALLSEDAVRQPHPVCPDDL